MKLEEGEAAVLKLWGPPAEQSMGPVRVNRQLTEEHPWGWVIHLVPQDSPDGRSPGNQGAIAVARETGLSIPIGTKGLQDALRVILVTPER